RIPVREVVGHRGSEIEFGLLEAVIDVVGEHAALRAARERRNLDARAPLGDGIRRERGRCRRHGQPQSRSRNHCAPRKTCLHSYPPLIRFRAVPWRALPRLSDNARGIRYLCKVPSPCRAGRPVLRFRQHCGLLLLPAISGPIALSTRFGIVSPARRAKPSPGTAIMAPTTKTYLISREEHGQGAGGAARRSAGDGCLDRRR